MKKKVLVVEDNEFNMMLEKELLELADFEVFEAAKASSGIAIAKKDNPDIIIMDMGLPDMRGSDAAKILRQDKATCGIPIVFLTASVMPGERKDLELEGISNSRLMSKPLDTRTFAEDIRQFLELVREEPRASEGQPPCSPSAPTA